MNNFNYKALPWNIVFGVGSLQHLPSKLDDLGYNCALVLSTSQQADQGRMISELLDNRAAGLFSEAAMHVPMETVYKAEAEAKKVNADCTVSIGGGSTTGLSKALALRMGLPNIVIPTSYAGSEMTDIWGMTENGRKVTGRDDHVVPTLTIYDPELTLSMPAAFTGASGLNALAQAVVNVASADANPIVMMMALEAVRALSKGLQKLNNNPNDIEARSAALYGACLAGGSLGTGATSLHHRLCHTFGGTFNTPHAETHTILLPHCVAYNSAATKDGTRRLAEALDVENAGLGIFELAKTLGVVTALKDIGITESDLDRAAAIATEVPVKNPEPVSTKRVRKLLENAFYGLPPQPIS
ncbi:maleylacetate reductase [Sneathiella sp. CAU 1612]|uniref:Maleylacetate reductase n=1 Tax=Sneathiella sedimenti TaxID=2816034 RepID=A0ABS3F6M7_9PROT|nr:maleylacetate reductase [Sneathiella sedimenti]MBO0334029.1 maleylacetate reductase [Sneathiella sedimenti]